MEAPDNHPTDPENLEKAKAQLEGLKQQGKVTNEDGVSTSAGEPKDAGTDTSGKAKKAAKKKRGKSKGQIKRDKLLAIARSITPKHVKAKMRPCRHRGESKPQLMHTYRSAVRELKRRGYQDIKKAWVAVAEDTLGRTVLRCLAEDYTPSKHRSACEVKAWPCPTYYVGDKYELYPIPPENESAEDWLPDRVFDEVVQRSPREFFAFLPPIRKLCNALELFVPPDEYDPNDEGRGVTNGRHQAQSSHRENVIRSLEYLGLLDYDFYYGIDHECSAHLDDYVESFYRDSFRDSREVIDREDPRSLWCRLRVIKDKHDTENEDESELIEDLRESIQKLAYEAYMAGRDASRLELLNEKGKALIEGKKMIDGRSKKGDTALSHTDQFKAALAAFEKVGKESATSTKVRDFIMASKNDKWIKAYEDHGFNSLDGVVTRNRKKKR